MLSGLFGSKKGQTEQPLKLTYNKQAAAGRKLFADARFGRFMRTAALHGEGELEGYREWRKAVYTGPETKWALFNVEEKPDFVGNEACIEKTKTLETGLNFFEAVEKLAHYETGQLNLGFTIVGEEKDELGNQHYQNFAEREGIIFDNMGVPHPTIEGEIVTDGEFSKEAVKKARAFKRDHPAPVDYADDLLSHIVEQKQGSEQAFKKLIRDVKNKSYIDEIVARLDETISVLHCAFEKQVWKDASRDITTTTHHDFHDPVEYPSLYGDSIKDSNAAGVLRQALAKVRSSSSLRRISIHNNSTVSDYVHTQIDECKNLVSRLSLSDEQKSDLRKTMSAYKTIYDVMAAKYMLNRISLNPSTSASETERVERAIRQAEDYYKQNIEDTAGTWRISAYVFDERKLKIPEKAYEINETMRTICNQMAKEVTRSRNTALYITTKP